MNKTITKKRAEMTSKEVVGLIIIILCFLVVLIFMGIIQWKSNSNRDSCHVSLVIRSTFNFPVLEFGKAFPLSCKTENTCLTMSGNECGDAYGISTKDNPVTTTKIQLDKDPVVAREQVKNFIADNMYDCNSMLGEGKLDFMPHSIMNQNYCMICSRYALDKTAMEKIKPIAYWEIYDLLSKKQTIGGKTYLESIYPGWKNPRDSEKLFEAMKSSDSANNLFKNTQYVDWNIDLNRSQGNFIAATMSPYGWYKKAAKIGGVVVGSAVTLGLLSWAAPTTAIGVMVLGVSGKAITTGAIAYSGYIFIYDHPDQNYEYGAPISYPYDEEYLNALKCRSFETVP